MNNSTTNHPPWAQKLREGFEHMKTTSQEAIAAAKSTVSQKIKEANQSIRDHVGQPSYTGTIDAVRKEIETRKRNLRKLHHELEQLEVAMSNLSDDRNVAYYNSRKDYVKQSIEKERFHLEDLHAELESLMGRLKAEQAR